MTRLIQTMGIIGLACAAMLLGGCQSDPGKVSKGEVEKVRQTSAQMDVGTSKDDVLQAYKGAGQYRLSSTSHKGHQVEEYKIEAYHDDDWNRSRDQVIQFLYFVDDALVEISDSRVNYRENAAILDRWVGSATE